MPIPLDPQLLVPAGSLAWVGRKLLGPLLGDIAEGWQERHEEFRRRNFERILEKAARKAGDEIQQTGAVHPRVGAHMLEDGSWCDDDLMAEYLGGVLAASRSPDGTDDRGAMWAGLVTRLSAYEVRTHYLLYSAARPLLMAETDLHPGYSNQLDERPIYISATEYSETMAIDPADSSDIVGHSLRGLRREQLIGDEWGSAEPEVLQTLSFSRGRRIPETGLMFNVTGPGIELYLWAHGKRSSDLKFFVHPEEVFTIDPPLIAPGASFVRDLPTL